MNEKNDNVLKSINVPNSNHQNYQKIDKSRNINEHQELHYKFSNIIKDIINNKPFFELNKKEMENQINSNLFIPFSFKGKRIYKEFNISNHNYNDKKDNFTRHQIKEEKNLLLNKQNNLVNINSDNNNFQHNIQQVNNSNNIDFQNISPSKELDASSDNNNELNLLGKKRNLENNPEIDKIKLLYDEIKKKYNEYINNNKNSLEKININIFTHESEYFKIEETIVIKEVPMCILYLAYGHITKIYYIKEEKYYDDEENIKYILEAIISKFEEIINK